MAAFVKIVRSLFIVEPLYLCKCYYVITFASKNGMRGMVKILVIIIKLSSPF